MVVAVVTAANVLEGVGLRKLLLAARQFQVNLERLIVIYVDGGYKGENLFVWVIATFRACSQIGVASPRESWICSLTEALGCGAHLWLTDLVSPLKSRL